MPCEVGLSTPFLHKITPSSLSSYPAKAGCGLPEVYLLESDLIALPGTGPIMGRRSSGNRI